jgi:hypothetical protein
MGCPNPETLRFAQGDRMEVLDSSLRWNDSYRKAGMTIVGRRE